MVDTRNHRRRKDAEPQRVNGCGRFGPRQWGPSGIFLDPEDAEQKIAHTTSLTGPPTLWIRAPWVTLGPSHRWQLVPRDSTLRQRRRMGGVVDPPAFSSPSESSDEDGLVERHRITGMGSAIGNASPSMKRMTSSGAATSRIAKASRLSRGVRANRRHDMVEPLGIHCSSMPSSEPHTRYKFRPCARARIVQR